MNRHLLAVGLVAVLTTSLAPSGALAQVTTLSAGQTVSGSLAEGDTASYAIDVQEDWFVFGEVDQISVDVVVRVLGPDGEQRMRIDGPDRGPERFSGETTSSGRYTIQVIPIEDESGEYAITLHRLEPLESDPERLTDQLMSPYAMDDGPGAAVAVWRDGRTLYERAYGMANLAYDIPFEVHTRTNIGSTSKQFTAFAVMLQAERGALSLDDDIRKHVPELPEFEETITVRHLITHTSGLREVYNLLIMTGRRLDHGDYVDRDEILAIVQKQPKLQNSPGAEWNYNNTAFALAAMIVERTSGQDFDDYMAEHVFEPLGMTRTMVRPHAEAIVPESSQGYQVSGDGYREIRDLGGAVGAGAIYSTVEDLQTWVENYRNPKVGTRAMIDEMMTSYVLADGDSTGYGYGLSIDEQRGLRRVHHGGADIAHRSMLIYYPEIGAGITTQSNHASFNSNVAGRIAEAFFEDAMEPEEEDEAEGEGTFDPDSYDPEDFDEFVGRYALDAAPAFVMTFTREGETLYAQATGQPRLTLVPTSDTTFTLTGVDASIVFHREEDGTVEGLTLRQNGEQHATRLEDGDEAWAPSPGELEAFTGRYFSEEIETWFTIALEEESLVARHRRLDDATLEPGDEDTFSAGALTFSFERDRNGRVIGFYMANGRTRDVRFERVR
jgi:CubicO group peptidase (beta-lactamase class C family)